MNKISNVVAFDISKASTGIARMVDGDLAFFNTLKFKDSADWDDQITRFLSRRKPDLVVFSETVNKMCSHSTNRILYGLMYHLEHICYQLGISVIPINDTPAKHSIGVKMKKREQIKADTIDWARQTYGLDVTDDEADAICFAHYALHSLDLEEV